MADLKQLEGKTIAKIETPDDLYIDESIYMDCNIVITFTDGKILKLASWDYEGYNSGIEQEII